MRLAPTVGRPTSRLSLTIGRMNRSVRQTSRRHADLPRDRHRRCTIRPSRRQRGRGRTTRSTVVRQLPRNRQQFHRPRSARSAELPNDRAQWDDRRPASCFPVASARRNAGSLTDANGNRQLDCLHKYPSLSVQLMIQRALRLLLAAGDQRRRHPDRRSRATSIVGRRICRRARKNKNSASNQTLRPVAGLS